MVYCGDYVDMKRFNYMKHKHVISTVHPGSIAEEMGIEPGIDC